MSVFETTIRVIGKGVNHQGVVFVKNGRLGDAMVTIKMQISLPDCLLVGGWQFGLRQGRCKCLKGQHCYCATVD